MSEITYTTIQGKSVAVTLKDKKRWENNTTPKQRNDPDFKVEFGNNLIEKSKRLVEANNVSEISNQRQNVPEKSLQERSKSTYDDNDESEFTKGRGNWRSYPTDEQLKKLKELGYAGPRPKKSREAFLEIAKLIRTTENSKKLLNQLNYSGEYPKMESDAISLIDKLRPPTKTQLEKIRESNVREIPKSYIDAENLIKSQKDVSKDQKRKLDKYKIRNVPKNRKEASDILDQFENGTLEQPPPCPKCKGEQEFFDGAKEHDPCPYCDGTGNEKDFDEIKGDQAISDSENQELDNAYDSGDTDQSEFDIETNDSYQNVGEELNWKNNFYEN